MIAAKLKAVFGFVTAQTNLTGGISLLAGSNSLPIPTASGIRTILIGDSYIDREMNYTTDNRTHQSSWGSIVWANFFLGAPLQIVKEMGIGGERVTDVLARVSLVKAFDPKIIFLSVGINDLKNTVIGGSSVVTGVPYAADTRQVELPYVKEKYAQLLAALENTGATVFVMSITPPNGAYLVKELSHRTMLFNRWLQYMCDKSPNTHYLGVDRAVFDPAVSTGDVLSGYYVSDAVHKSITGAFKSGQYIAARLKPYLAGNLTDRLPTSNLETHSNMIVNGTAISCDGTSLVVTINNLTSTYRRFQPGDRCTLSAAGDTRWNGVYTLTAVSDTTVTAACTVATATYTGTVKLSNSTQMFTNPLFITQSGNGAPTSGGITLTAGATAAGIAVNGPATMSVTVTYATHTDLDGVATIFGSWIEMEIVAGAAGTFKLLLTISKNAPGDTASAYYARIFPGDVINAQCDLELLGTPTPSAVTNISGGAALNYKDTGGNVVSGTLETLYYSTGATENMPQTALRGTLQTCDWQMPSGALTEATTVDGMIKVVFSAAGTAKIRVGRFGLNRVDLSVRDASTPASYQ